MIKEMICVECPVGCHLKVEIENGTIVNISGEKCPKGEKYAEMEIQAPKRVLTSTVLAEGLSCKMIPVRTNGPVPRDRIFEAMDKIQKVTVSRPVKAGEVILPGFLGLNIDLISTREVL